MTSIDVENTIYVTLCPFFFLADNYAQFVTWILILISCVF